MNNKISFSIDRGGTFTDIVSNVGGKTIVTKLLSVSPHYKDAPTEGIRRVLEQVYGDKIPPTDPVPCKHIASIRCGTTVATNALLERKGVPTALVTTRGFRDILEIGNQSRPKIFELCIQKPELIYQAVVEVDERVRIVHKSGAGAAPAIEHLKGVRTVVGATGELVEVLVEPDLDVVRMQLENLLKSGVRSIAVVFLHSYAYGEHERRVATLARALGFDHVSMSHDTVGSVRVVERGLTTAVDAYLTPLVREYIANFKRGFDADLSHVALSFMMSDGGLCHVDSFNGYRSILSGPAGGVVGYAKACFDGAPLVGFDMGGTSTDVSHFDGDYHHIFETQISGVSILAPQLDISTVAAGGGSRLFFRAGLFVVGPESAGANPGPTCYGREGPLAVTDANLILGRIQERHFPKVFGVDGKQALDCSAAQRKFDNELVAAINSYLTRDGAAPMSRDLAALGFLRVANEAMCRPIRALMQGRGLSPAKHTLVAFGSAGPQHAVAMARLLGMPRVAVHRHCGVLSAYGIGIADCVREAQRAVSQTFEVRDESESDIATPDTAAHVAATSVTNDAAFWERFDASFDALAAPLIEALVVEDNAQRERIVVQKFLNLRYRGTDTAIMVKRPDDLNYAAAFLRIHTREYGFVLHKRAIEIDHVRVRVVARGADVDASDDATSASDAQSPPLPAPIDSVRCFYDVDGGRWLDTPVYTLDALARGSLLHGPCHILLPTSSIVVEPQSSARVTARGDVMIDVAMRAANATSTECDLVQLSVFAHRFMSIAEQMGFTLRRTAISVNIKERLDFSCALFGADGSLVANAPHLPVHLGAMQEAVKWQIAHLGSRWREGDVIMSNHPGAGGSHLPDMTVLSAVFHNGRPVFYVASRGHHADVGGITPGSMPPHSRSLSEEGVCFASEFIVRDGVFDDALVTKLLSTPPAAGVAASRCLHDNLSDLKAQAAANQRGIALVHALIEEYSLDVVLAYMGHVQNAAASAVQNMLRRIADDVVAKRRAADDVVDDDAVVSVRAEDRMDCGAAIKLTMSIDRRRGSATLDFTGSSEQLLTNINAPKAVTFSAVIYSLRCLVREDIPLNSGCLTPITILIPRYSILWPSDEAAVVGGNVLTSQRVTDVVLEAFGATANSYGCMNNFTFGDASSGYYETIGGGTGAGATFDGADGVQAHMTNTRITDPETLERRFAVLLRSFAVRRGSGGRGRHRGGDGLVRKVEFLAPMTAAILSERRALQPRGYDGGGNGLSGLNLLHRRDGRLINITGTMALRVEPGDAIEILTPGGGGYGRPVE